MKQHTKDEQNKPKSPKLKENKPTEIKWNKHDNNNKEDQNKMKPNRAKLKKKTNAT